MMNSVVFILHWTVNQSHVIVSKIIRLQEQPKLLRLLSDVWTDNSSLNKSVLSGSARRLVTL
jgi:hypothetical protein